MRSAPRFSRMALVALGVTASARAHTFGEVEETCPLDGATFRATAPAPPADR